MYMWMTGKKATTEPLPITAPDLMAVGPSTTRCYEPTESSGHRHCAGEVLRQVGQALARLFSRARPAGARSPRTPTQAAAAVWSCMRTLLKHIKSPGTDPAAIASALRELVAARDKLAATAPHAATLIDHDLIDRLENAVGSARLRALATHTSSANEVLRSGAHFEVNGPRDRYLSNFQTALALAVIERAVDETAARIDVLRNPWRGEGPGQKTQIDVAAANAGLINVVEQQTKRLVQCGALHSLPPDLQNDSAAALLQMALAKCEARDGAIDAFLPVLDANLLKKLSVPIVPQGSRWTEAVQQEVDTRPQRLTQRIEIALEIFANLPGTEPSARPETGSKGHLDLSAAIREIAECKEQLLAHHVAQHSTVPEDTRNLLKQVDASVRNALVASRAAVVAAKFDTVVLAARENKLDAFIAEKMSGVVKSAREGSATLLSDGIMPLDDVTRDQATDLTAEEMATAKLLQAGLTVCLRQMKTPDIDVGTLMQHVKVEDLPLFLAPVDESEVPAAAVFEIARRRNALSEPMSRSQNDPGPDAQSDLETLHKQRRELLALQILDKQSSELLRSPIESSDARSEELLKSTWSSKSSVVELGRAKRSAQNLLPKKSEVMQSIMSRATEVLANSREQAVDAIRTFLLRPYDKTDSARWLTDCGAAIDRLHEYRDAQGALDSDVPAQDAFADWLKPFLLSSVQDQLPSRQTQQTMHKGLQGKEFGMALEVLRRAAQLEQAQSDIQRYTRLRDAITLLECSFEVAGKPVSPPTSRQIASASAKVAGADDLGDKTLDVLGGQFSVVLTKQRTVALTSGRFASDFLEKMKEVIQEPFSEKELAGHVLSNGMAVPYQFYLDMKRPGFNYSIDGLDQMMDHRNWDTISADEQEKRIGEAYQRLVRYYQNNEKQARAIALLANQSVQAGFKTAAMLHPETSPYRLAGYGPGTLENPYDRRTREISSFHFSTSSDGVPTVDVRYEVYGGALRPLSGPGFHSHDEFVYLDPDRSRARADVRCALGENSDHLVVVGEPSYDIHLVANQFQRPYPIPKRVDLLASSHESTKLLEDLRAFNPEAGPDIYTLEHIVRFLDGRRSSVGNKWLQIDKLHAMTSKFAAIDLQSAPTPVRHALHEVDAVMTALPSLFTNVIERCNAELLVSPGMSAARKAEFEHFKEMSQKFNQIPSFVLAANMCNMATDELFSPEAVRTIRENFTTVENRLAKALTAISENLATQLAELLPRLTDCYHKEPSIPFDETLT